MANRCFKQKMVSEHLTTFRALHLEAGDGFADASLEDVCAAYNGIGPDRLPWWARGFVTLSARIFAPAALIHDFEYEDLITYYTDWGVDEFPNAGLDAWVQDMLGEEMQLANRRFWLNCQTLVRFRYGVLNPLRYLWLGIARLFFMLCERYGMRGILDGIRVRARLRDEASTMVSDLFGGAQ